MEKNSEEEEEEVCNTRLELGLGKKDDNNNIIIDSQKPLYFLDLWFKLCNDRNQKAQNTPTADQQALDSSAAAAEKSSHNYGGGGDENNSGGRKKLKLSKDQYTVLEDCFKSHNTLNPTMNTQAQKQALAEQLGLKQRQIEVWFQNRRARTKLKKTEEDYEVLKKRCESLSRENKKLREELQDLKDQQSGKELLLHSRFPIAAGACQRKQQIALLLKD